jgi:hypothetical protein
MLRPHPKNGFKKKNGREKEKTKNEITVNQEQNNILFQNRISYHVVFTRCNLRISIIKVQNEEKKQHENHSVHQVIILFQNHYFLYMDFLIY